MSAKRCFSCGRYYSDEEAFVNAPDHPWCCLKHGFIDLCPDCYQRYFFDYAETDGICFKDWKKRKTMSLKNKFPSNSVEAAKRHHAKHGDMDGHTCLLSECALHYPREAKTT